MQRLVVALLVGLLCAPLLALTACGGGGGAGMGDPYDARMVLQNVITAGQDGDFTKARPHLDVAEWPRGQDCVAEVPVALGVHAQRDVRVVEVEVSGDLGRLAAHSPVLLTRRRSAVGQGVFDPHPWQP